MDFEDIERQPIAEQAERQASVVADELLQELTSLLVGRHETGGGMTTREIMSALGINPKKAISLLHQLQDRKMLEVVTVYRVSLSGINQPIAGYRIKSSKTHQADETESA